MLENHGLRLKIVPPQGAVSKSHKLSKADIDAIGRAVAAQLDGIVKKSIFNVTATQLINRPTTVHFLDLKDKGARGLAYLQEGAGVIVLDPALAPERLIKTFLHEAIHLREHRAGISNKPAPAGMTPAQVVDVSTTHKDAGEEDEAETEACRMYDRAYLRAYPGRGLNSQEPDVNRLLAALLRLRFEN